MQDRLRAREWPPCSEYEAIGGARDEQSEGVSHSSLVVDRHVAVGDEAVQNRPCFGLIGIGAEH